MKHCIYYISLLFFLEFSSAQTWHPVGTDKMVYGYTGIESLKVIDGLLFITGNFGTTISNIKDLGVWNGVDIAPFGTSFYSCYAVRDAEKYK